MLSSPTLRQTHGVTDSYAPMSPPSALNQLRRPIDKDRYKMLASLNTLMNTEETKSSSGLARMAETLRQKRVQVMALHAQKAVLLQTLSELEARALSSQQEAQRLGDGISLIQGFSAGIQTDVIRRFEDLVTQAVREVLGRDYTVSIDYQAKANSFWADFYITLPNGKKVNLANGEGGGFGDLCAIMNRILYLVLDPTNPAKILFIDEPISALDEWRSPSAIPLIMRIATGLGIQVLFITHNEKFSSGEVDVAGARVIRFSLDGESTVSDVVKQG